MRLLPIFVGVGGVSLLYVFWRVWRAFRDLHEHAQKDKGFTMRRSSLSPREWKEWNSEFMEWRLLRIIFWLAFGEGILLALALRRFQLLPTILPFILLLQLIPFTLVYLLNLWLIFRYGRFNLGRFDPEQLAFRQLAFLLISFAAWMPLASVWLYFRIFT